MKNHRIKTNNNSIIIRQQQEGYNNGETEIPKTSPQQTTTLRYLFVWVLQAYKIEHERLLWMRRYKTIILQDIIMPINNDEQNDGSGTK